jgi:DNA-binding CsgD family transcriptional regulator
MLVLLQALVAVFFVGDVAADLVADPTSAHSILELVVVLVLVLGLWLGIVQLRAVAERLRAQDRALATARGALGDVVSDQFETWGLTPAERDVGLMALKGLDVAEIAGLRGVAEGTVRAQLTRVYAKAGVSGRAQFAAWFVEDLLADGLPGSDTPR